MGSILKNCFLPSSHACMYLSMHRSSSAATLIRLQSAGKMLATAHMFDDCCSIAHGECSVQAGRAVTRAHLEWLILHGQCQYLTDVLCGTELYALAFDIASDPDLPLATAPVLLRWAREVIDRLGHDADACLRHLRQRLDRAPGVSWATVAGYALVRILSLLLVTLFRMHTSRRGQPAIRPRHCRCECVWGYTRDMHYRAPVMLRHSRNQLRMILQERHFSTLGEGLLALDRRDRSVVPQLMRLQPRSPLALSKALATCDGDLVLHVLLHSYEELALEGLRSGEGGSTSGRVGTNVAAGGRRSSDGGAQRFAPFYAYLRDGGGKGGAPRGLVRDQAYDAWHKFVHSMVVPLPNAALVRLPTCSQRALVRPRISNRAALAL